MCLITRQSYPDPMDEFAVDRVLHCVDLVPAGAVVSYGDIARIVGLGPRQVGAILSRHGNEVTWWRVTNHTGKLPADLLVEAAKHWREEGIAIAASGTGCRIGAHRADLHQLALAFRQATQPTSASVEGAGLSPRSGPRHSEYPTRWHS